MEKWWMLDASAYRAKNISNIYYNKSHTIEAQFINFHKLHCIRFGGSGANIGRCMFARVWQSFAGSIHCYITVTNYYSSLVTIWNMLLNYVCEQSLASRLHFLYVLWLLTFFRIDIFPITCSSMKWIFNSNKNVGVFLQRQLYFAVPFNLSPARISSSAEYV